MKSYQIGEYRVELFNTEFCEESGLYVYSLYKSNDRIGSIRISKTKNVKEVKFYSREYIPFEYIDISKSFMEVLSNEI